MNFERRCFLEGRIENEKFSLSMSRGYMTLGKTGSNPLIAAYFTFPMYDCDDLLGLLQEALKEVREI